MRLSVPATAPVGETAVAWTLVTGTGRVVIADLATGGPRIEVVGD
jgi:hypothetical protein